MHARYLKKFLRHDPTELPVLLPPAFWVICGLKLLELGEDQNESKEAILDELEYQKVLDLLSSCQRDIGWAASSDKLAEFSILATLSAVQILTILKRPVPDKEHLIGKIRSGLSPAGGCTVSLSTGGREDIRFLYCAVACMRLLGASWPERDAKLIKTFVMSCEAPGGGFGCEPGAEAHGGHTWCALAILNSVCSDETRGWLLRRGVTGRPGKSRDSCYAWWIGASLAIINEPSTASEQDFLRSCECAGGWSDRPGKSPDLFHSFFALAGSLLVKMDPFTAMPKC